MLKIQYEKELEAGHVTVQTKFNYAWGLVKSPKYEHQVNGVKLLQGESGVFSFFFLTLRRVYIFLSTLLVLPSCACFRGEALFRFSVAAT